jgi:hypothetical protein
VVEEQVDTDFQMVLHQVVIQQVQVHWVLLVYQFQEQDILLVAVLEVDPVQADLLASLVELEVVEQELQMLQVHHKLDQVLNVEELIQVVAEVVLGLELVDLEVQEL